jgi:hypothetical protein
MSHLLFIDECGQDHKKTPYEVLAGVSIHDSSLWQLIQEIKSREQYYFGDFYNNDKQELKARKILKRKIFRLASQSQKIDSDHVTSLAKECLNHGPNSTRTEITALAQAKLLFVEELFDILIKYRCQVFASIINYRNPNPTLPILDWSQINWLRRDYAYLFERFFYFLEDENQRTASDEMGIVIFDELEKTKSHILLEQMTGYFQKTYKGKQRSRYIIPEPVFVHSDLTTGVFLADIIAYCINYAFRLDAMTEPKRDELNKYITPICEMRYLAKRMIPSINKTSLSEIWSITFIN